MNTIKGITLMKRTARRRLKTQHVLQISSNVLVEIAFHLNVSFIISSMLYEVIKILLILGVCDFESDCDLPPSSSIRGRLTAYNINNV